MSKNDETPKGTNHPAAQHVQQVAPGVAVEYRDPTLMDSEQWHAALHEQMEVISRSLVERHVRELKSNDQLWANVKKSRERLKQDAAYRAGYLTALNTFMSYSMMQLRHTSAAAMQLDPKSVLADEYAAILRATFLQGLEVVGHAAASYHYARRMYKLDKADLDTFEMVNIAAHERLMPIAEALDAHKEKPVGATIN